MSKEDKPQPAATARTKSPNEPRICEAIPSREDGISALASAHAPFVFFDSVPFFGQADGIGSVTLTALRNISAGPGQLSSDRVITANLRASVPALVRLRDAIDGVIKMVEQEQADKASIGDQLPTVQ